MAPSGEVIALEEILRRVATDLDSIGVRWALVGGLAVSARARPRFTNDIDLAVAVADDSVAESVVFELGRTYQVTACLEHAERARLSTVRLIPPRQDAEGIVVDLLFASSGIEAELASGATQLEVFEGLSIPVASAEHLVATKVLAMDDICCLLDRADIAALMETLDPSGLARVSALLGLIEARGFHRDRDLAARWAGLLDDYASGR